MKRSNDKALTGSEWFFVFLILLLILMTGGMAYLIQTMGPDNNPDCVIEDVYLERGPNETYTAYIYVTNIGKSKADTDFKWELTKGTRLIDEGQKDKMIEGRTTEQVQIDFGVDRWSNSDLNLEMKVLHKGNTMDTMDHGFTA